ncbi:hypothetical protein CPY51_24640 [Rhizobium tubonense]|uniref:DUF3426 domain-containing protein n=2 Tax=Rhizobium tubonense TaxID=484088 RepID=A0A2W4CGT0_9HYPH|nr:hypothetical protein CPY51_24640 [Rhizobium tubonense]
MGAFRYRQQQTGLVYDLLPPEVQASPRPHNHFERKLEVTDAEFVTVIPTRANGSSTKNVNDNRRYQRSMKNATASPVAEIARICIRAGECWLQRASGRTFAALVGAIFTLVFGLSGGFSGLSATPVPTPVAAALQFSHVTLTPKDANGMRLLVVNGIIENRTDAAVSVPLIRADLVSGDRLLSSIVVTPPTGRLDSGSSRGFSARLQHPGGKTPEVRLSFQP